jgi:surface-anchored protein
VDARRRARLLAAPVLAVVALVVGACTAPTAPAPTTPSTTTTTVPKYVFSVGHADVFEVTVVPAGSGQALEVQIKDSSGPSVLWRDPAQTILQAKPASQTTVPNPAGSFAFLGTPGAPIWLLPQIQDPNLLWPGISTERIGTGVLQGNNLNWVIDSVSGPGRFVVYQTDAFGTPQVWFTSNAALPQTKTVGVNVHAHFNWAFGATGTYTVVMRATATLANGTPVTSGPVPYTFRVGAL